MLKFTDSHAHYDDTAFDDDRDTLLTQMHENGVEKIINIACSESSCKTSAALAEKYPFVYFAAGIHPDEAEKVGSDYLCLIASLCGHRKCVAVGEIGLDYSHDTDREKQLVLFEEQMRLALKQDKPVVIHTRDAWDDTLDILRKYRPRGVVHCFSGSAEIASEIIKLGMYIGFTGVITFKNAKKAVAAAEIIPADRLLTETDCPYMAPEPYRGQRSNSGMITEIIRKLAGIKGTTPEEMAHITSQNADRLFGVGEIG